MKANQRAIFFLKYAALLLAGLLLAGCAAVGQSDFRLGSEAYQRQDYDQAVLSFFAAVESDPANQQFRLNLKQAMSKSSMVHKKKGDELFAAEQYREALQEYQVAAELDRTAFAVQDNIVATRKHLQAEGLIREAEDLLAVNRRTQAAELVQRSLTILPDYQPALELREHFQKNRPVEIDGVRLDLVSDEPINLNFNRTRLTDAINVLSRLSGINFILDEDVRVTFTSLHLEQATFAQALELMLRMNRLDKKILNSKTIILYPKTREKQKEFEDHIIQSFYLSHIDAKKAVNLLRTMLQIRRIYVHEERNAIVIRDQPDVIRLAQKILEANDRGDSEVVFDLELIEVNHSDSLQLGLKLDSYSIGAGLGDSGADTLVASGFRPDALTGLVPTDGLIKSFSGLAPFYTLPTASFRFAKTLGSAEVLANPKIRVKNNAKAKVHVGTREPVVTVTITDGQVSENVQYLDVGVKLNVEPVVQLDGTIVTKMGLEVSNVSLRDRTSNGTAVITISSTNADTTLTLVDGEQTIIGGLIRDDQSVTKNKVPLLGDIPLLGSAFNATDKANSKREILLSITPHIVKSVHVPQGDSASIWSGSEDHLAYGRNFKSFSDDTQTGLEDFYFPLDEPWLVEAGSDASGAEMRSYQVLDHEVEQMKSPPVRSRHSGTW